jgi:hypothetical protein
MIYKTFKEWAAGLWLEDGEPRKQAYTRDELLLIEMGWNYGKEAGVAAEREACAKVCEEMAVDGDTYGMAYSEECAAAIRARGRSEALTNLNKAAEDMGQEL